MRNPKTWSAISLVALFLLGDAAHAAVDKNNVNRVSSSSTILS
jgi:hypothetical protein